MLRHSIQIELPGHLVFSLNPVSSENGRQTTPRPDLVEGKARATGGDVSVGLTSLAHWRPLGELAELAALAALAPGLVSGFEANFGASCKASLDQLTRAPPRATQCEFGGPAG